MKISYAITVCNEFVEIQRLVSFLLKHKRHEDDIVVLYDIENGSEGIEQFLRAKSVNCEIAWMPGTFDGHFKKKKREWTSLPPPPFLGVAPSSRGAKLCVLEKRVRNRYRFTSLTMFELKP